MERVLERHETFEEVQRVHDSKYTLNKKQDKDKLKTKNHFLSFSSLSRFFSFFVSPSPDFAFFLSIFRSSFSAWVSGRGASCGGGCSVFCVSSSCFLPSMVVDGAEVSAADAADPSAAASEDDEDDARRDDSG